MKKKWLYKYFTPSGTCEWMDKETAMATIFFMKTTAECRMYRLRVDPMEALVHQMNTTECIKPERVQILKPEQGEIYYKNATWVDIPIPAPGEW